MLPSLVEPVAAGEAGRKDAEDAKSREADRCRFSFAGLGGLRALASGCTVDSYLACGYGLNDHFANQF